MRLHIDFETRSRVDLRSCGVHKYAEDPLTDILCVGIGKDDSPVFVVAPKQMPQWVLDHVASGGEVVSHNAAFEKTIWNSVGVRKYGWPPLKATQLNCTMARAYAMALPASLDASSKAVGLSMEKDMAGQRLMMKLSQPKAVPFFEGRVEWHEEPELMKRLFAYCSTDVVVEALLDKKLIGMMPRERRIWELDQTINDRGILVNVAAVKKALDVVDAEVIRLNNEMRKLTGNQVSTCNANVRLAEWLRAYGFDVEGVAKDDVSKLLAQPNLPPVVRRVLEVRQEAAKSSTKKLQAMLNGACADGRLRGLYQYHGASTGRWTGRRIQTQNLPRPSLKPHEIEEVFTALETMPPAVFREHCTFFYKSVLAVLSDCLRGFLVAPKGKKFIGGDWNAIEARTLVWLAGEEAVLNVFRTHGKIYEATAALIYATELGAITEEDFRRQIGKVAILALGYQGGVGAFMVMAKAYGVDMATAFPSLWALATDSQRDMAILRWEDPKVKRHGMKKEEWLACEILKVTWRERHPKIVSFWHEVERAAIEAVREPGKVVHARKVKFVVNGSFLWCKLPSGRNLCYPYPEVKMVKTPWGVDKEALVYLSENSTTQKFERVTAYGGLLVENITQAVARDILADTMVLLEEAGFPIVLHVHDEFLCEVDESVTVESVKKVASSIPPWAPDLPLKVGLKEGRRYQK